MAGVLTDTGQQGLLPNATVQTWLQGLTLRLFVNNYTPTRADTAANYTEATWSGYAAVALTSWTIAGYDANGNAEFDAPQKTFTASSGSPSQTIYGYYLTDGGGNVVFAEADPSPFTVNATGQTYQVTAHFYVGQLAAPF